MKLKLIALMLAVLLCGCGREPKVGDVYAEYVDNRNNQYALTNGFHAELVRIHKVTAVSNGMVYCAVLSLPITNRAEYPFPFNTYGPASNFKKYKQYRTLVKPNPKSE